MTNEKEARFGWMLYKGRVGIKNQFQFWIFMIFHVPFCTFLEMAYVNLQYTVYILQTSQ